MKLSEAMSEDANAGLPPGFVLDNQLPPGFVLDKPTAGRTPAALTPGSQRYRNLAAQLASIANGDDAERAR